jgi:hypothetical protein
MRALIQVIAVTFFLFGGIFFSAVICIARACLRADRRNKQRDSLGAAVLRTKNL